jgi:hypothetical protein
MIMRVKLFVFNCLLPTAYYKLSIYFPEHNIE